MHWYENKVVFCILSLKVLHRQAHINETNDERTGPANKHRRKGELEASLSKRECTLKHNLNSPEVRL